MYQEIDDTVGQADAFNGIGSVYYEVKNYRDSILTLQKSFDLIEDYKSNNILAKVLHGLGEATYHLGNFKKSKDYFLQCIKLCEEHGFKQVSVFANEGMANIYFNQKNKEKKKYFYHINEAIEMARQIEFKVGLSNVLHLKGTFYLDSNNEKEAFKISR